MVYVKDEGAELEAPIAAVWKFLQSGEAHARAHRSMRNRQAKPAGENVMVATLERNWKGTWVKVTNRLTLFPPLGMAVEVLEGPFAGSRSFTVYTPRGARTGIDVYGEFTSAQIPPAQIEAEARAWLTESFDEDAPAVKAFAARK
jgi:hypothetical protein